MTFGTARDLPSQVVAIPTASFGMLMNSPDSEFQSPDKRGSHQHLPDGSELWIPGHCPIFEDLLEIQAQEE